MCASAAPLSRSILSSTPMYNGSRSLMPNPGLENFSRSLKDCKFPLEMLLPLVTPCSNCSCVSTLWSRKWASTATSAASTFSLESSVDPSTFAVDWSCLALCAVPGFVRCARLCALCLALCVVPGSLCCAWLSALSSALNAWFGKAPFLFLSS